MCAHCVHWPIAAKRGYSTWTYLREIVREAVTGARVVSNIGALVAVCLVRVLALCQGFARAVLPCPSHM